MLKFKGSWRYTPPPDGKWINQTIPQSAIGDFYDLVAKIATQGNRQEVLEHFKGAFYNVKGIQHVWSSDVGWAETDFLRSMEDASDNAPLFIEAFYDACVTLSEKNPEIFVPDVEIINAVCAKNNIGYEIHPPNLLLLEPSILEEKNSTPNDFDFIGPDAKIENLTFYKFYDSDVIHKPKRFLQIFLCHSSNDKPKVRELYKQLRRDGFKPWLDEEDLLPGQDWQQEIPNAVRKSDIVLVCLSKSSVNKIGYIQKEIKYALDVADEQPDGAIFLIPVKLEECEVPPRLKKWQWVNLFNDNGYQRLIRSLDERATMKAKS